LLRSRCRRAAEQAQSKAAAARLLWAGRRYARIGSVVMILHDPSDICLEAAKVASYAGAEAPSTALFAALLLTWCSLRLGVLPFWVIRSALCAPSAPRPRDAATSSWRDSKTFVYYQAYTCLLNGVFGAAQHGLSLRGDT